MMESVPHEVNGFAVSKGKRGHIRIECTKSLIRLQLKCDSQDIDDDLVGSAVERHQPRCRS